MMNFVLNRHGYLMLDIGYGHRGSYYNALEKSQTRDDDLPFLKWFMKRYTREHRRLATAHAGSGLRGPVVRRD